MQSQPHIRRNMNHGSNSTAPTHAVHRSNGDGSGLTTPTDMERQALSSMSRRSSHAMIRGGWKSVSTAGGSAQNSAEAAQLEVRYHDYPLLLGMMRHESTRTAMLEENGKKQIFYRKSNDGWFQTLLVWEGRALDRFIVPWMITTVNAIIWTVLTEEVFSDTSQVDLSSYETFFSLVLNSSLAFLLVFRLNRSAERFWDARASWGAIVAYSRSMISDILVHGAHDTIVRDDIVRWIIAFSVATMQFIRSKPSIHPDMLIGILNEGDVQELSNASHPGLYAADKLRWLLKLAFLVDANTPLPIAHERMQHLQTHDELLNGLILQMGALERIRATPLPLVYVSHMRTFLICFILAMPYVWVGTLGYATIPITCLTGFALFGLEGAAQEVESPFQQDRTNHLSMDAYCLLVMGNTKQQVRQCAEREISQKYHDHAHARSQELLHQEGATSDTGLDTHVEEASTSSAATHDC